VEFVVYADDIILLMSSVNALQKALEICQCELENMDMYLKLKKTCCLRGLMLDARVL